MKSNLFQLALSSVAILLGFSGCQKEETKDCEDCFRYIDDPRVYTLCESDFVSREEFELYRAYYMSIDGSTELERCE